VGLNNKRYTTQEWIQKAKLIHGDKYDYSKSIYTKALIKLIIICPVHGEFYQTASSHINNKSGCSRCFYDNNPHNNLKRRPLEQFIKDCNIIHNNKYDYSKTIYINSNKYVTIICPDHGDFQQFPYNHRNMKQSCPKCADKIKGLSKRKTSSDNFISKASYIHNNKYDYSKVNYNDCRSKIIIICPRHGEFTQSPASHLVGCGCTVCALENARNKTRKTLEQFIKEANHIHNNLYNYSKTNYKSVEHKIDIICFEHGIFKQTPHMHLIGQGCPKCRKSFGHNNIRKYLITKNIYHVEEYWFDNCRNSKTKRPLYFDFYLVDLKICIEFDGRQHYIPCSFGSDQTLETKTKNLQALQFRDKIKTDYCEMNGINLIRIPYTEFNNIEQILNSVIL